MQNDIASPFALASVSGNAMSNYCFSTRQSED